jgi:hypothetical protein
LPVRDRVACSPNPHVSPVHELNGVAVPPGLRKFQFQIRIRPLLVFSG